MNIHLFKVTKLTLVTSKIHLRVWGLSFLRRNWSNSWKHCPLMVSHATCLMPRARHLPGDLAYCALEFSVFTVQRHFWLELSLPPQAPLHIGHQHIVIWGLEQLQNKIKMGFIYLPVWQHGRTKLITDYKAKAWISFMTMKNVCISMSMLCDFERPVLMTAH